MLPNTVTDVNMEDRPAEHRSPLSSKPHAEEELFLSMGELLRAIRQSRFLKDSHPSLKEEIDFVGDSDYT